MLAHHFTAQYPTNYLDKSSTVTNGTEVAKPHKAAARTKGIVLRGKQLRVVHFEGTYLDARSCMHRDMYITDGEDKRHALSRGISGTRRGPR